MAKGKVTQIIGTVIDIEFPQDGLPKINNAIEINQGSGKIIKRSGYHSESSHSRSLCVLKISSIKDCISLNFSNNLSSSVFSVSL